MPEDEDRGLLDEVVVEDTAVVGVTVVDSVSLNVEEEEVEEEEEEEDVVEVEEDDEEVVPSLEAPFSTVKVGLTASSPDESMISIS